MTSGMSRLTAVLFALLMSVAGSKAQSLDYFVTNMIFEDGGTGAVSFMFDDVTSTYGNVRITTTADSIRTTGVTYLFVCGQDLIACNWGHDAGFAREGTCGDPACDTGVPPGRTLFAPGGVAGSSQTLEQYLFFGS